MLFKYVVLPTGNILKKEGHLVQVTLVKEPEIIEHSADYSFRDKGRPTRNGVKCA